jgi:hypothetical protein
MVQITKNPVVRDILLHLAELDATLRDSGSVVLLRLNRFIYETGPQMVLVAG